MHGAFFCGTLALTDQDSCTVSHVFSYAQPVMGKTILGNGLLNYFYMSGQNETILGIVQGDWDGWLASASVVMQLFSLQIFNNIDMLLQCLAAEILGQSVSHPIENLVLWGCGFVWCTPPC